MAGSARSLESAREFADRICRTRVDGVPLGQWKALGRFSFTPSFAVSLTFGHIRSKDQRPQFRVPRLTVFKLLFVSGIELMWTLIRRPSVFVYAVDKTSAKDHDMRMEGVYQFLYEHKVSFVECLHTIVADSFLPNLKRRGRGALYLEALTVLFRVRERFVRQPEQDIDLSLFSEDERPHARAIIQSRHMQMREIEFQIAFWAWVLRVCKPKAVFSIDDMRQSVILTAAAEVAGIPMYWFQHGHYTRYHLGYLGEKEEGAPLPTAVIVWSEYWKNELNALGTYIPDDRIVVGGILHRLPHLRNPRPGPFKQLSVLVPYETAADKIETAKYLTKLLQDEHVRVYLKLRKDMPRDRQIQEYGIAESERFICIDEYEPYLEEIDVVAGVYSTLLYDLMAHGLPVAIFGTGSEFGARMVENGLATPLSLEEGNLTEALRKVAGLSEHGRQELRNRLYGKEPVLLRDSLARLGRELGIVG